MSEKIVYEVLLAKERRVEVSGNSEDDAWDTAERERSGDERIISVKEKEKEKK